MHQCLKFILLE